MSDVKRWWPQLLMGDDVEMRVEPCPYPEDPLYVLASDYDALKTERDQLYTQLDKAIEWANDQNQRLGNAITALSILGFERDGPWPALEATFMLPHPDDNHPAVLAQKAVNRRAWAMRDAVQPAATRDKS